MLGIYTISTNAEHIKKQFELTGRVKYERAYQARPGMILPIIILENGHLKFVTARWVPVSGLTENKEYQMSIDISKVLSTNPFKYQIRRNRCSILLNCFFGLHKDEPFLIRVLGQRLMCAGGLFTKSFSPNGYEYRFTMLHVNAADVLMPMAKSMPVLFTPDDSNDWLTKDKLYEIISFADKSHEHWFDFFKVSNSVLDPQSNNLDALNPLGISREGMRTRERKLMALKLDKERANRGSKR